jgi:RNA polymerase sigma-70 factor (ECF subfamily)
MAASERERELSGEPGRLLAWRIDRLRRAGCSNRLINLLVGESAYDLHALLDLIDRGCPPELAARILAPLGEVPARLIAQHSRPRQRAREVYSVGTGGSSQGSSRATRAQRESRIWVERLTATGAERDAALVQLQALLSRAVRFELSRRAHAAGEDEDLALRSADTARVMILSELDAYDGGSSFTTWASKFALHVAGANARKRAWSGRELALTMPSPALEVDDHQRSAERTRPSAPELSVLSQALEDELSPHEREVLVALAIDGMPIDALAEWLNTTRDALYRTLRAGQQRLAAALDARGVRHPPSAGAGRGTPAAACRTEDRLIARLTGPVGPQLSCDECFERLDRCVELELEPAGAERDAMAPAMRAHLEGCSACEEDQQSLRALLMRDSTANGKDGPRA